MNFKRYQKEAMKFAEFNDPLYPFFALPEETGELIGLIAKWRRGDVDEVDMRKFRKEAGDVLWQLTACLEYFNISLNEIAMDNINKLHDRKERGVIKGSGDDR